VLLGCLLEAVEAAATATPCEKNQDCQERYNEAYECEKRLCLRRHYTYDNREVTGMAFLVVLSTVSNAGGVGAGTVVVPLYSYFFGFDSNDAVHLSRITIFAGALVNFFINWKKRDLRSKDRLLINYDLASVMIPLHLAGAEFGVILGKFMPSIAITFLLFLFMLLSLVKTWDRAKAETKKEFSRFRLKSSKPAEPQQQDSWKSDSNSTPSDLGDNPSAPGVAVPPKLRLSEEQSITEEAEDSHKEAVREERPNSFDDSTPQKISTLRYDGVFYLERFATMKDHELVSEQRGNFSLLAAGFAVVLLSALIRGGEGRPSIIGFATCSKSAWKVLYLSQVLCLGLAYRGFAQNKSRLEVQSQESLTMAHDRSIRAKLFVASYVTGLASGVVGVGGGMLLSIYMLSLGMEVHLCTALSMIAILFSSCSTTLQSLVVGGIHLRHAYAVLATSFVGSLVGNCCLKAAIKKADKPSIILWILFFVLLVAAVVVPCQMILSVFQKPLASLSFGKLC